jgi:hypothetical protein
MTSIEYLSGVSCQVLILAKEDRVAMTVSCPTKSRTHTQQLRNKKPKRNSKALRKPRRYGFSVIDDGKGTFVKSYFAVTDDWSLKDFDHRLYLWLRGLALGYKELDAHIDWIVKSTGKGRSSVFVALKALEKKGLISRDESLITFKTVRSVYGNDIDKIPTLTANGVKLKPKKRSPKASPENGADSPENGTDSPENGTVVSLENRTTRLENRTTRPENRIPKTPESETSKSVVEPVVEENKSHGTDIAIGDSKRKEEKKPFLTEKGGDIKSPLVKASKALPSSTKRSNSLMSFQTEKSQRHSTPKKAPPKHVSANTFNSVLGGMASVKRQGAVKKVKDVGDLPTTAPAVYKRFRAKLLERHPEARLPAMVSSRDLGNVKADVMKYDPADIATMIDILIIEWPRLRTMCWPYAPDQSLPSFEHLYLKNYRNMLADAIPNGVHGKGINRSSNWNPETGKANEDWHLERFFEDK